MTEGAPAREGMHILNEDGDKIGVVTSGVSSPCLKKPLGMAYVEKKYFKSGTKLQVQTQNHSDPNHSDPKPLRPKTCTTRLTSVAIDSCHGSWCLLPQKRSLTSTLKSAGCVSYATYLTQLYHPAYLTQLYLEE